MSQLSIDSDTPFQVGASDPDLDSAATSELTRFSTEIDVVETFVESVRSNQVAAVAAVEITIEATPTRTRRILRKWKLFAVALLVVVLAIEIKLVAPFLYNAASALKKPDLRWLTLAVLTEFCSMGAFARVQRRMLSAGGARVSIYHMAMLTYAANAVSVSFPGGTALSSSYVFRRLRSWGATGPAASFSILASGVLSTFSFALLALACALLAGSGGLDSVFEIAAVVIVALAALVTRRRRRPELMLRLVSRVLIRANRLLRRDPMAGMATLQRYGAELAAIKPRKRDWFAGLSFASLNWIADLVCLVACCQAVGAKGSSLLLVTIAYVAGMSTSGVSLVPGGFGVVDVAMIFVLTQGGVGTVPATAGVLLYRLVSFVLVVAIGWLVWTATWFADRRRAARGESCTSLSTQSVSRRPIWGKPVRHS